MSYRYQDLPESTFQAMVGEICKYLFGIATKIFTQGKDSGIDGMFSGTSQLYPSVVDPWSGIIIIQAKHTNKCDAAFSDNDFLTLANSGVISQEIPKISKLIKEDRLTHYIIFSNRKLTSAVSHELSSRISKETKLPYNNIALIGVDELDSYLDSMTDVKDKFLSRFEEPDPFTFSPDSLAKTVEEIAYALKQFSEGKSKTRNKSFVRTEFEEKNRLNSMTPPFASILRKKYLQDSDEIESFLSDPDNTNILRQFEEAEDDLQTNIIAFRNKFETFDTLWVHLVDTLKGRSTILRTHKRTFLAMLFYMYWHCDIGISNDDISNEAF